MIKPFFDGTEEYEGIDYVICPVPGCRERMKAITNSHVKKAHRMTMLTFKKFHSKAKLTCWKTRSKQRGSGKRRFEGLEEREEQSRKLRQVYKNNSSLRQKISNSLKQTHMDDLSIAVRMSESQKQSYVNDPGRGFRHSKVLRQHYIDNPDAGCKVGEAIRQAYVDNPELGRRISEVVTRRYKDPEERRRTGESIRQAYIDHPEYRLKQSENNSGENNAMWRGGRSLDSYSVEWNEKLRRSIRERDDHSCQLCGKTKEEEGQNLSVHHIDEDKQNNHPDNLISLCTACHMRLNRRGMTQALSPLFSAITRGELPGGGWASFLSEDNPDVLVTMVDSVESGVYNRI